MKPSLYFPLFVDLSAKKIIVIGAGTIARRRVQVLSDFTEHITVIASDIHPDIQILENDGKLTVIQKNYESSDIDDADIVLAATNDEILNRKIAEQCRQKHLLVNNCSDRSQCDFYFPGIIHTDDIVIGITANGRDHSKAKQMTEQIKKTLNQEWMKTVSGYGVKREKPEYDDLVRLAEKQGLPLDEVLASIDWVSD